MNSFTQQKSQGAASTRSRLWKSCLTGIWVGTMLLTNLVGPVQAAPSADMEKKAAPVVAADVPGVTSEWLSAIEKQIYGSQPNINSHRLPSSPNWTVGGAEEKDYYGISVKTAGDVNGDGYSDVIVGASGFDDNLSETGKAYVYYGSSTGLSTTPAWSATGPAAHSYFGFSVSTAGDVNGDGYSDIIVGAYGAPDTGGTAVGKAYVYHGSNSGLSTTPAWTGIGNRYNGSEYGYSVSTAGDVNNDGYSDVIVGWRKFTLGALTYRGETLVYLGSSSGLATTAVWTYNGTSSNAYFGSSVSWAGDVNGDGYSDVIVGAENQTVSGNAAAGAAYVFLGNSSGVDSTAAWSASGIMADEYLGHSVATAGDVNSDGYADIIVGAYGYSYREFQQGLAALYYGSSSGPASTPSWTITGDPNYQLGFSVNTAGDVNGDGYADVIIGVPGYYNVVTSTYGEIQAYYGSPNGLNSTPDWTVEEFLDVLDGMAVGPAGDVNGDGYADIIIGEPYYYNGELTDEGYAKVYHGSISGPSTTANFTADGAQSEMQFGFSVANAGDVNGDGYADLIIGAPYYNTTGGLADAGKVFVYYGAAGGFNSTPSWTKEGTQGGAWFGYSVNSAGDVNGDGYDDIVIGEPEQGLNQGTFYLYTGSSTGLSTTGWSASIPSEYSGKGASVSGVGDVDGDGYGDVLVGLPGHATLQLYFGTGTGLNETDKITFAAGYGCNFGNSVSGAGDINQDGLSDIIVGGLDCSSNYNWEGMTIIYFGNTQRTSILTTSPLWSALGGQTLAYFGNSVSSTGDVNGDGYSDIIVGAPNYDNGQTNEGKVFVYHGAASNMDTTADWSLENNVADANLGTSVNTVGDVNADGYTDIIVGAPNYTNGQSSEGIAYLYYGGASGINTTAAWTVESNQANAAFGKSVAGGDFNGDGYADLVVGAPGYNGSTGRVYVYYGNGGQGVGLKPQQAQYDVNYNVTTAPIAHSGKSNTTDSFRLVLLGRTPFGRGSAKLQWQVALAGSDFGSTYTATTWTNLDVAGTSLKQNITGLTTGSSYHWRVRMVYQQANLPYQQYSRWITIPWNGKLEKDLRTSN